MSIVRVCKIPRARMRRCVRYTVSFERPDSEASEIFTHDRYDHKLNENYQIILIFRLLHTEGLVCYQREKTMLQNNKIMIYMTTNLRAYWNRRQKSLDLCIKRIQYRTLCGKAFSFIHILQKEKPWQNVKVKVDKVGLQKKSFNLF